MNSIVPLVASAAEVSQSTAQHHQQQQTQQQAQPQVQAQQAQQQVQPAEGMQQQFVGLTSVLLHRQQLLSQLYMTTASICQLRDQMSPADLQCLTDQAQSLRWCALQQEWLAPSATANNTNPSTTVDSMRDTGQLQDSALGDSLHEFNDHQTVIRVRHQVAAARLASQVYTESEQKFFSRYDTDIARHIARAKPRVAAHRWTPKKDLGEPKGKAPNMTVGTFEKFLGLSAYVASAWNNSNPPFKIKSMLSFSPHGFVYCMACRYTYGNMHNDYRKVTEHFLSVAHLARCRELAAEEAAGQTPAIAGGESGTEVKQIEAVSASDSSESDSEPFSDSGPEMEPPEPEKVLKKKEDGKKKVAKKRKGTHPKKNKVKKAKIVTEGGADENEETHSEGEEKDKKDDADKTEKKPGKKSLKKSKKGKKATDKKLKKAKKN